MSEWAKVLAQSLGDEDVIPDGWKTTGQIAAEIGKSNPRTSALIREGVVAGRISVRSFRIRHGSLLGPVPHYKISAMCEHCPEDFEPFDDETVNDPRNQVGLSAAKNVSRSGSAPRASSGRRKPADEREVPSRASRTRREPI